MYLCMYNECPALTSCLVSTITAQDVAIPKETIYTLFLDNRPTLEEAIYTNGCVHQHSSVATVVLFSSVFVHSRSSVFRL